MVVKARRFSSLHNHSYYSLLDATMSPDEVVQQAHDFGFKAIALTEHGNMFSFVDGYKKAKELGIKYIFGVECYETTTMELKTIESDRYHLILLAKSKKGLENLFRIVTHSYTDGFYGKARIDLRTIEKLGAEDIICMTACLGGRLSRLLVKTRCACCSTEEESIMAHNPEWHNAFKWVNKYKRVFGENFYIELQNHDTPAQSTANKLLLKLAEKTGTKYTVTFDTHMRDGSELQQDIHRKFLLVGADREIGETTYNGCWQTDIDGIHAVMDKQIGYEAVERAIDTTDEISEQCNVELELGKNLMPHINIPKGFKSDTEYLKYLVNQGWKKRGFDKLSDNMKEVYKKRLQYEMDVLEYLDFPSYFIMLKQLVDAFRKEGIPLGYSRGSGGNCLTLFTIGVTEVDSIRWGLDFSRFANKGRKSLADYDMDISQMKRQRAIEIATEMFGTENVAQLATFNRLSPKVCIRDLGKVFHEQGIYNIPYEVRDKIAKLIPDDASKDVRIEEALEISPALRKYAQQYPLLFEYTKYLQYLPKSAGCHAAAVILSPRPVSEFAPLMKNKQGNIMMQLEMHNAMDDLGLCKMDFLGLVTVDVVDMTVQLAGLTWDDISLQKLNLEDQRVFDEIYGKGNTLGIFQMEKYVVQEMFQQMKPDNINDIFAVNAMNRPAILSVGMEKVYIHNKNHPEDLTYIHNDLEVAFRQTHGVCIAKGEFISTPYGYKRIEDLSEGNVIHTLNGSEKIRKIWSNGFKNTLKLRLSNGRSVECTPEHLILTANGWKMAKDLNDDDTIAYRVNSDQRYLNNKISNEKIVILANLLGDGMLTQKGSIAFINANYDVALRFKKCVESEYNELTCNIKERDSRVNKNPLYYQYVSWKVPSKKEKPVTKWLKEIGLKYENGYGCHANDKFIPQIVFELDVESKKLFLGAFFDTDGCMDKMGNIRFKTSSKELAYGIQEIGRLIGYSFTVTRNDEKSYDITCKNSECLLGDIRRYSILLKDKSYLAEKKQNKRGFVSGKVLQNYIQNYKDTSFNKLALECGFEKQNLLRLKNKPSRLSKMSTVDKLSTKIKFPNLWFNNNIYWESIKSIEYNETKIEVFDIEVENEHNFICNGVVVHNCLYQEQALKVFELAGFPEEERDNARRAIGKKKADVMANLFEKFYKGLISRGWNKDQINEIWRLIEAQSTYSFNKGHSSAYGLLSYVTAWLKLYYPVEFMTALLISEIGDYAKTSQYINEAMRMNIPVLPPNINKSDRLYTIDNGQILFGLESIKGVGGKAVDLILAERQGGEYKDFKAFLERCCSDSTRWLYGSKLDTTTIISLIQSGAFGNNKEQLLLQYAYALFDKKEFKPLKTFPTKKKMMELELISTDTEFKDKELCLTRYNEYKKREFNKEQQDKYGKHLLEFTSKYMQEPEMYEFNTLSIFLNGNPFQEVAHTFRKTFEDYEDEARCIVAGTITDIQYKKQRNGGKYAFINVLTLQGMIEGIVFSSKYTEYQDYIKKGMNLVFLAKKSGSQFVVEKVKTLAKWKEEKINKEKSLQV